MSIGSMEHMLSSSCSQSFSEPSFNENNGSCLFFETPFFYGLKLSKENNGRVGLAGFANAVEKLFMIRRRLIALPRSSRSSYYS